MDTLMNYINPLMYRINEYGIYGNIVTGLLATFIVFTLYNRLRCRRHSDTDDGPQPKWEWFCISNVIAMIIFGISVSHLVRNWGTVGQFLPSSSSSSTVSTTGISSTFTSSVSLFNLYQQSPTFLFAGIGVLGSLLYFLAFFGVAFVYQDVRDMVQDAEENRLSSQARHGKRLDTDYDVVIVGMGIVGGSLATVLARQGKRVAVIESARNPEETIKGELLQPGGVRALERMGIADTVKDATIDSVRVDGYVCMTPGAAGTGESASLSNCNSSSSSSSISSTKEEMVVLSYPSEDPTTVSQYIGLVDKHSSSSASSRTPPVDKSTVGTGKVEVCPVTGNDIAPRGRAFHHTRFIRSLRNAALAEPNVTVFWGTSRRLVPAKEYHAERIEIYQKEATVIDYNGKGSSPFSFSTDPDRIVGVVWQDEHGREQLVTGRLTIAANGLFSNLRSQLHPNVPKKVSHFCGVVLKHPPHQPPLPHPNRGHVLLVDPNPVLFYQISPTDTRVLVDIPAKQYDEFGAEKYFRTVVAPQLPSYLRTPFLDAISTQKIHCMPCMALSGATPKKKGVVMIGDTLNMRHPLTGGGMTVAFKDVELFSKLMQPFDKLASAHVSERKLNQALSTFYAERIKHSSTINILANALHRVFTKPVTDDGTRARLRAACIDYLSMGGPYAAGPVGLLSGLTPAPWVLVSHFFAVAIYALKKALTPFPTFTRIRQGYDLMHVACVIIMPLLASERATILSWSLVQLIINIIFPWRNVSLD